MNQNMIDISGDPLIIQKVIELARYSGFSVSEPMPTESISDALDAPIGVDEVRAACEVITLISGSGVSIVLFLEAVKRLMSQSETSSGKAASVELKKTIGQKKIGKIEKDTDISNFGV